MLSGKSRNPLTTLNPRPASSTTTSGTVTAGSLRPGSGAALGRGHDDHHCDINQYHKHIAHIPSYIWASLSHRHAARRQSRSQVDRPEKTVFHECSCTLFNVASHATSDWEGCLARSQNERVGLFSFFMLRAPSAHTPQRPPTWGNSILTLNYTTLRTYGHCLIIDACNLRIVKGFQRPGHY
jgi:hypothetical protein